MTKKFSLKYSINSEISKFLEIFKRVPSNNINLDDLKINYL